MEKQELVERFRNYNVDIEATDSGIKLAQMLADETPDALWPMLEEFTKGKPIGMDCANEMMHSLTLRGALVKAFESGQDTITQEDIDVARERAAKTADSLSRNGSTRTDTPTVENDDDEAPASTGTTVSKPKRKKRLNLLPTIESLVEQNPKASPDEIYQMVLKREPTANESTVKVYYSKARNNLNLPKIGKRGRANSGIYDKIKAMVKANPETERAELIERIVNELGAKTGTAQAYYSKAKGELGL